MLELVPAPGQLPRSRAHHARRAAAGAAHQPGRGTRGGRGRRKRAEEHRGTARQGCRERLARGTARAHDVAWSPDSAWLAWCDPTEAGLSRVVLTGPPTARTQVTPAVPRQRPGLHHRRQAPGVPVSRRVFVDPTTSTPST
ncbi:hypothetical protein HBB16_14860 [Pseudonocardia sp. MCCB 268]|nr:hypothetical protein [Pseudonocardia cytotoxica]